jgi:folylpolyglutamate synthase/dihydropteroate synthase
VENDTHSTENAFLLQKQFIDSGVQSSVINIEEIEKKVIENENHLYVVFGSLYMIGDFLKNSQSFSMN